MRSFAGYLHSQELLDAVRLKPTAFLRHRKLPFAKLIAFLLSGTVASVQNELNAFAAHLDNRANLWHTVSAQAAAKARQGFSATVFDLLNRHLLHSAEHHLPLPRWRGYPAVWLIAALSIRGIPFCMRVDDTGFGCVKAFRQSGQRERWVTLAPPSKQDARDYDLPRKPSTVRLIRVTTPNGKSHIVMTSLLDAARCPADEFGNLYHARWRIEEAFKRLKHRLKLEHLSGLSWLAAQQDL